MELLIIIGGILLANLFSIFIVKNKILNQFTVITSIVIILFITPKYLNDYHLIENNFFEKYSK